MVCVERDLLLCPISLDLEEDLREEVDLAFLVDWTAPVLVWNLALRDLALSAILTEDRGLVIPLDVLKQLWDWTAFSLGGTIAADFSAFPLMTFSLADFMLVADFSAGLMLVADFSAGLTLVADFSAGLTLVADLLTTVTVVPPTLLLLQDLV